LALGQLEPSWPGARTKHGTPVTPGELRELGLLLFCSPWPEPVPLVLRRFLSLGAMARTDATPFVFNQLQRKPWVSRGNGFMQLSGLSAPSSQDSRVRA